MKNMKKKIKKKKKKQKTKYVAILCMTKYTTFPGVPPSQPGALPASLQQQQAAVLGDGGKPNPGTGRGKEGLSSFQRVTNI